MTDKSMDLLLVPMRGIGQVFFQENALSGALMLAGLAAGSPGTALTALAGNLAATLAARLLHRPAGEIDRGLWSFNGTLVGIAAGLFFPWGWQAALLLVAGAVLTVPLAQLFARLRIPGYTAPFILSTWLLLGLAALLWPSLRLPGETIVATTPRWTEALALHFGQVMFEGRSLLCGALFLAGIALNDRRGALFALWGALVPLLTALLVDDYGAFNAGLYGYNGVLCALALAAPSVRSAMGWATLAVVLSTALQWYGLEAGIVTLTAPFVLAVWATRMLRNAGILLLRGARQSARS